MEEFIRQLLSDAGVPDNVDDKVRSQLESDLTSRATDFVNKRLIDSLGTEQVSDLEKLIDSHPDDQQAIINFIDKNVPEKEKITGLALLEFRALYLGNKA